MKIAMFGATGRIGRIVVDRLLTADHQVIALVRTPSKLTREHPALEVRTGSLTDPAAVYDAVRGTDGVISALGPSLKPGTSGTPVTQATRTIVSAMRDAGVRRLVGLATPSMPDPHDLPTAKAKILPIVAKSMFPNAFTDLVGMTEVVTGSDLDWTLARISRPTDGAAKGTLRVGYLGRVPVRLSMTRADIADFLVAQLTDETYLRALPAISN